jgi:hypothetical protein
MVKIETRIRGAGLLAACLRRYAPVLSPSNSRKRIGELANYFDLLTGAPRPIGERSLCGIVPRLSATNFGRGSQPANGAATSKSTFRHKIEDDFCPSVRGVFAVCPGETNALETEFSRQRASSRSRGGAVYRLPLRPGPQLESLKALGISSGGQARGFKKGSGVSL